MSVGAPWSVKGIDPKAREIAKDLARRSGMTLGEWLNQMILDDAEEESAERKPASVGSERRARLRSVEGGLSVDAEARDAGLERVTRALEGLAQRIEAAELRSTQAIGGVDRAVAGLLGRLETAERGQGPRRSSSNGPPTSCAPTRPASPIVCAGWSRRRPAPGRCRR